MDYSFKITTNFDVANKNIFPNLNSKSHNGSATSGAGYENATLRIGVI